MCKKRIILFPILLMLLICTPICTFYTEVPRNVSASAKVKLNAKKKTLLKGKSFQLKLKNNKRKIKWTSSKKKVATVNKNGKVKAKKVGTTIITATVANKKYTCKLTVENPKISYSTLKIYQGDAVPLYIDGTNCDYTWVSSDNNVINAEDSYDLKALNPGTCTLTTTVLGKHFSCAVTVLEPFVTSDAMAKFEKTEQRVNQKILVQLKNNYMYDISLSLTCKFYNNGTYVGSSESHAYVKSGANSAAIIEGPYSNKTYKDLAYTDYKITYSIDDTLDIVELCNDNISYSSKYGKESVLIMDQTSCPKDCSAVFVVIFYKDNKIIDVKENTSFFEKKKSDILTFDFPYDKNYDTITPDSYEVILQSAYHY